MHFEKQQLYYMLLNYWCQFTDIVKNMAKKLQLQVLEPLSHIDFKCGNSLICQITYSSSAKTILQNHHQCIQILQGLRLCNNIYC